jgi:hypothetical protein
MLPVRFDDIGSADILHLVEEKTSERKRLEYKEKLTIETGDQKAEFLADISSFANASGGDIIFGISDVRDESGNATGVPDKIKPLKFESVQIELARIESIIQSGIQPRLPDVHPKAVEIPDIGTVIVIRIGKSWLAPHMITYANRTRFYSRNTTLGKFQLDVQQIGAAFASQRGMGERLRSWKADRISKSVAGEGPVVLEGPRILFHFISAAALTDEQSLPRIFDRSKWGNAYRLMYTSVHSQRYNADGLLAISRKDTVQGQSYLQIFRDGSLEYGDSYVLNNFDMKIVPSAVFESKLVETFIGALSLLKHLEAAEPVFVSLTLVGVKGMVMALPQDMRSYSFNHSTQSEPFDRDVIVCPDMLAQNLEEGTPYPSTLRPIVDAVWQAAGREKTPYTAEWKVGREDEP